MEKQQLLKAFYQTKIADMVEYVDDVELLDLIYKLLKEELQ